jgi:hypothetical protein
MPAPQMASASASPGNEMSVPRLAALFQPGVTRFDQLFEFFLLLSNALGRPLFIPRARRRRSLFNQLPDIALKYRDAVVEFGYRKRIVVAHVRPPGFDRVSDSLSLPNVAV